VPILLSYLCYEQKIGGFGPEVWTSDDVRADMDKIREFYVGKVGKRAEQNSRIRLREEDESDSTPVQ